MEEKEDEKNNWRDIWQPPGVGMVLQTTEPPGRGLKSNLFQLHNFSLAPLITKYEMI